MHRKVVGMLFCRDASHPFVPLVCDATDAEYDQCNADKVQEYWLFALRAEESIKDRKPAPVHRGQVVRND